MPDTLTIPDRVRKIIDEQFYLDPIPVEDDLDLQNDLRGDSLDAIELVMRLEEEFGIEIGDDQWEAWRTVGDVIKTVEAQR